ncbi:hypothetical protein [Reichenbachiella versicolor]|uniref:hypothetical protein n=1 Tax=Reichenbachiella versicolor TaxID=1821036 RepID=UPI000D6EA85B|nr:hypothetical protein [Reichenbachiella versicolor]
MSSSYLEYSKLILSKLVFDPELFWKEYRKALKELEVDEQVLLQIWTESIAQKEQKWSGTFRIKCRLIKLIRS